MLAAWTPRRWPRGSSGRCPQALPHRSRRMCLRAPAVRPRWRRSSEAFLHRLRSSRCGSGGSWDGWYQSPGPPLPSLSTWPRGPQRSLRRSWRSRGQRWRPQHQQPYPLPSPLSPTRNERHAPTLLRLRKRRHPGRLRETSPVMQPRHARSRCRSGGVRRSQKR